MKTFYNSINDTLEQTLKEKIVNHRDEFKRIFKARYMEMLPSLVNYKNADSVAVDFMKVEIALRNGFDVIIGETRSNNIQVIGYATSEKTSNNPSDLFSNNNLRHADINFIIPKHLQMNYYKEITNHDSYKTGNFIVLRNKNLNYISDIHILNHYIEELSEIVLSRYSISMQVKISTLFLGEPNDETLNQIISDVYNGNPYIKGSLLFDPQEHIYHMKNEHIAQNFAELKREYQNKISELNAMLGMSSLAVEKESGVSDEEVKGNRGFKTSNANIYLDGRNNGLKRLNKRYDLDIEAIYNDEVASEIQTITGNDKGVNENDNLDNNNVIQNNTI